MNVWSNAVITAKGQALLAKLIKGNTLNIVDAVVGAGFVTPGLLKEQTGVLDPQQTLKARPVSYPETGRCDLTLALTNEGVGKGYEATQVGIFASDPDEGKILFFIAQSISADNGTNVPSETEMPGYSAEWTFRFQYGQADNVTVTVDPSNTVSKTELQAYFDEEFIPISKAQIDALVGYAGPTIDTGSGGATLDHSQLYNRNIAGQHTIGAITGLEAALNDAQGATLDSASIETAWDNASE